MPPNTISIYPLSVCMSPSALVCGLEEPPTFRKQDSLGQDSYSIVEKHQTPQLQHKPTHSTLKRTAGPLKEESLASRIITGFLRGLYLLFSTANPAYCASEVDGDQETPYAKLVNPDYTASTRRRYNTIPVIPVGDRVAAVGRPLTFDVRIHEVYWEIWRDGNPDYRGLEFSVLNLEGAAFNNNIFAWTPAMDDLGTHQNVGILVKDGPREYYEVITIDVVSLERANSIRRVGPGAAIWLSTSLYGWYSKFAISDSGRFIAFATPKLLLPDAPSQLPDQQYYLSNHYKLYLYDTATGETKRLPLPFDNTAVDGNPYIISGLNFGADEQFLTFQAARDFDLPLPDNAGHWVYDISSQTVISTNDRNWRSLLNPCNPAAIEYDPPTADDKYEVQQAYWQTCGRDLESLPPSVSDESYSDGCHSCAFSTTRSDVVPNDHNDTSDAFVSNMITGEIERVSMSSAGEEANRGSAAAVLAGNGRFAVFTSFANNLVPNDTNNANDVFAHDRKYGLTTRISTSSSGREGHESDYIIYASFYGSSVVVASTNPFMYEPSPEGVFLYLASLDHFFPD